MSDIENIGRIFGSRRYARDYLECPIGQLPLTKRWWGTPSAFNLRVEESKRAEQARAQSDRDPFEDAR